MKATSEPIDGIDRAPLDIRGKVILPDAGSGHPVHRPLLLRKTVAIDSHGDAKANECVRHWIKHRLPGVGRVRPGGARAEDRPTSSHWIEAHHVPRIESCVWLLVRCFAWTIRLGGHLHHSWNQVKEAPFRVPDPPDVVRALGLNLSSGATVRILQAPGRRRGPPRG